MADVRIHGTTGVRPVDRLVDWRHRLQTMPPIDTLALFLRDDRRVGRDGYVRWERSSYGVAWTWMGQTVQIGATDHLVEIWAGSQRLAIHTRATQHGQRFPVPGQWDGLPVTDGRRRREPVAVQLPLVAVEQRALSATPRWSARVHRDRARASPPLPEPAWADPRRPRPRQPTRRRDPQAAALPRSAGRPSRPGGRGATRTLPAHSHQPDALPLPPHTRPVRLRLFSPRSTSARSASSPRSPSSPTRPTSSSWVHPASARPTSPSPSASAP